MPSFVLDTCCGCIELRTGCLVIGYLQLVSDIIMIVLGLVFLVGGGKAAAAQDPDLQEVGTLIIVLSVFFLLIGLVQLAFTIVLLVGVHQEKRGHVKAYLVSMYICLVLFVLGFFASFAGTITAGNVIYNIVILLLSIYITLVIRSYYLKMDDNRPQTYNTA